MSDESACKGPTRKAAEGRLGVVWRDGVWLITRTSCLGLVVTVRANVRATRHRQPRTAGNKSSNDEWEVFRLLAATEVGVSERTLLWAYVHRRIGTFSMPPIESLSGSSAGIPSRPCWKSD